MLSKEDCAVIRALNKRGVYQRDVAAELGVHPKTVSRALKRDGPPKGRHKRRGSKLDPHKETVDQLLRENVWNAVVVLREIQAEGYEGGLTILREYIAPKRALRSSRATVRFETGGMIRSFEYFGGVPQEVLVDNQKTAVLEPSYSGQPRFNERFLDLAGHYGFVPRACRPYRARTKGKGERAVGYIKQHFFVRYRSFDSWGHLNRLAEQWLGTEVDQRVHGTVQEVVAERFAREQPALGSLPDRRYDTSYYETRHVGWDGYIDVRGNRYSIPGHLAGRTVAVRIGLGGMLRVYDGETLVTTHALKSARDGWVTVPEHHAELWQSTLQVERRPLEAYEEAASWS